MNQVVASTRLDLAHRLPVEQACYAVFVVHC